MGKLSDFFNPLYVELRRIGKSKPTCCEQLAEFVNVVYSTSGDKYFYQCNKCKKIFILGNSSLHD